MIDPMESPKQRIVVDIPPRLGRDVRKTLLYGENAPYQDLSEAVVAALESLLVLYGSPPAVEGNGTPPPAAEAFQVSASPIPVDDLLLRPEEGVAQDLPMEAHVAPTKPLFALTNRLNPFPTASRVLVNMASQGPVPVDSFIREASGFARTIGLHLRDEDRRMGRKGSQKLHVGWPVGEDSEKSLDRFAWSFLVWPKTNNGGGPMVELGLAVTRENFVLPTREAFELAQAPNPILREASGGVLCAYQQELLRRLIAGMEDEADEVEFFLRAVTDNEGSQPLVDDSLLADNQGWSRNQVIAHRAAMLGRLRDLGVLVVEGSGPSALISLTPEGRKYLAELGERFDNTTRSRDA